MKQTLLKISAALALIATGGLLYQWTSGCTQKKVSDYCQSQLPDKVKIMITGELFSKNPNHCMIAIIPDPKNWDNNLYLTPYGLSQYDNDAIKFPEYDTCLVKESFFRWLREHPNSLIKSLGKYDSTLTSGKEPNIGIGTPLNKGFKMFIVDSAGSIILDKASVLFRNGVGDNVFLVSPDSSFIEFAGKRYVPEPPLKFKPVLPDTIKL